MMPRRLLRLLLPVLLLVSAGCATPPSVIPPQTLTYPPLEFRLPEVPRETLESGLRLFWREDRELPLVEVTVLAGAGAIAEPEGKVGLGALFAAALRAGGTAGRSPDAIDQELERLAADLSVATDEYLTTFHLSVRSQDLEAGLTLLAELIREPAFEETRVEVVRKQVVEGIRRRNDRPGSIAGRLIREELYRDHPLGRTPTVETVRAVTRGDLFDFHRRFFAAGNLRLGISGDFDPGRVKELLEGLFAGWETGSAEPGTYPPLPEPPPARLLLVAKELTQTTILRGEVGIDKSAPDQYAVRVLNYLLGGGGFNSRLMREIRSNRGLAYSVYSHFEIGPQLPGLFLAGAETKSGSTVQVVELMGEIMAQLREAPVTAEELDLARESLVNSFIFAFDDSHEVVAREMRMDVFDYPEDYLDRYQERIAAVTAADVLEAARKRLHPDRQAVVLVGDPGAFDEDPTTLDLPVTERGAEE